MNDQTNSIHTAEADAPQVLRKAAFDPKLKLYNFLNYLVALAASIIGLPIALLWVLGLGFYWTNRQFRALHCELTPRKLSVRRGVLFKVEKTIPLEQIQDLTVKEGPLLKAFGLCALKIETAGQSSTGGSEADLVGIIDPRQFRDEVLAQRDRLTTDARSEGPATATGQDDLLVEIRDLLGDIRSQLGRALDQKDSGST